MSLFIDNTYLTDLKVGDKVIEHHKSGLELVSTVKSIDNTYIVVKRSDNTEVKYWTDSAMIVVPYGATVPNMYLLQYISPTASTPFKPGPVSSDAEVFDPKDGN